MHTDKSELKQHGKNDLSVSIVIPTFNEKENIEILIPEIKSLLHDMAHEIIIVDDSSTDGTIETIEELQKKFEHIRLIVRKDKRGIGSALIDGYNHAKGNIILSSDSDLSFKTADMLLLIEKLQEGSDIVVGSRHLQHNSYKMRQLSTKIKGVISRFGNKLNMWLTGIDIHDFTANFRAIKKEVWEKIDARDNSNFVLAEMLILAHFKGYRVSEVPVEFRERVYGESKLRLFREVPKFMYRLFLLTWRQKKKANE